MDDWQWVSQNYEGILGVMWNFLLFALTVAGVIFGWKSIKMNLPSTVRKAKKEIVSYLQKYLVDSSKCEMSDIRSIINSVCTEHQLNPGSVVFEEIMDDLRTSILTNYFLDDGSRKSINRKLNEILSGSDWGLVEMKLDHYIFKNIGSEESEQADMKQSILNIFKEHLNYIEKQQSRKLSFALKEYRMNKSTMLILANFFLSLVLGFLLRDDPNMSKSLYVMIVVVGLMIIPFLSLVNFLTLKRIVKLGTIFENQSNVDIPVPFILRMTKRLMPPIIDN